MPRPAIALTSLLAGASCAVAWAGPGVWQDVRGDAQVRRTDAGADGPIGEHAVPTDLIRVKLSGWSSPNPASNPFAGVVANGAHLMRIEMVFAGVVAPPGPLDDAYRYGDSPAYGFLELDIDDDKNTGGELGGVALNRYLANVGRFGRMPKGSIGERVAKEGCELDFSFWSSPQFERSGAEFAVALCGCWEPTIVSQTGNKNGRFEPGESWVVRGRFFERVQGFAEASGFVGSTGFGFWDPETLARYTHIAFTDETIVEIVVPLTMEGAAAMAGEPLEEMDFDPENHTSVAEAINDFIIGADWAFDEVEELLDGWRGKEIQDYLDPTEWHATALFGLAYETEQPDAVYVWTDTGFDDRLGDINSDGVVSSADSNIVSNKLSSWDGGPKDADGSANGEFMLADFGLNFSVYDVNGDGFIVPCDAVALGRSADTNLDGTLSYFDLALYLSLYGNRDPEADFNGDGYVDYFDTVTYLSVYSGGCQ